MLGVLRTHSMIGRYGTDSNSLWMARIRFQRLLETVALFPNKRFLKLGTLTRPTTFKPTLSSHSETMRKHPKVPMWSSTAPRVSPIGQELAITSNIEGRATLTPRSNSEAQRVCFFFSLCPVYMITLVGTQELRLCPSRAAILDTCKLFLSSTILTGLNRSHKPWCT